MQNDGISALSAHIKTYKNIVGRLDNKRDTRVYSTNLGLLILIGFSSEADLNFLQSYRVRKIKIHAPFINKITGHMSFISTVKNVRKVLGTALHDSLTDYISILIAIDRLTDATTSLSKRSVVVAFIGVVAVVVAVVAIFGTMSA